MVPREPHIGAPGGDEGGDRIVVGVDGRLDRVAQLVEAPRQHGRDDRREIGEVRVDRRRGDARPPGDAPS
jgi:hypothetical protein